MICFGIFCLIRNILSRAFWNISKTLLSSASSEIPDLVCFMILVEWCRIIRSLIIIVLASNLEGQKSVIRPPLSVIRPPLYPYFYIPGIQNDPKIVNVLAQFFPSRFPAFLLIYYNITTRGVYKDGRYLLSLVLNFFLLLSPVQFFGINLSPVQFFPNVSTKNHKKIIDGPKNHQNLSPVLRAQKARPYISRAYYALCKRYRTTFFQT